LLSPDGELQNLLLVPAAAALEDCTQAAAAAAAAEGKNTNGNDNPGPPREPGRRQDEFAGSDHAVTALQ